MIAPIKPLVSRSILIYLWAEFLSFRNVFRSFISHTFWPAWGLSNSLERSFWALTVPVIENILIDSLSGVWIYCWRKKSNLSDVLCLTYCLQWKWIMLDHCFSIYGLNHWKSICMSKVLYICFKFALVDALVRTWNYTTFYSLFFNVCGSDSLHMVIWESIYQFCMQNASNGQ